MDSSNSTLWIAAGVCIVFVLVILVIFSFSIPRTGTIILPAGGTYLGPSR